MKTAHFASNRGSAILVALVIVGILIALGIASLTAINNRSIAMHQATSWHEALLTAEAGVEMALAEVRKELKGATPFAVGWTKTEENGDPSNPYLVYKRNCILGDKDDPNRDTNFVSRLAALAEGERGSTITEIVVDTQVKDQLTKEPCYRVRVTGVAELPGSGKWESSPGVAAPYSRGNAVAGDSADLNLRKFDFRLDHFLENHPAVPRPQATRRIEAIIVPTTAGADPMFGVKGVDMNNHNIVVDSWDSRDPSKSGPGGTYPWLNGNQRNGVDPDKQQWNGNVSTNGELINAGQAHVFGTVSTNGGEVENADNVTGNDKSYGENYEDNPNRIRSDFYRDVVTVNEPDATVAMAALDAINGDYELQASQGSPTQLKVQGITLSGSSDTLHIKGVNIAGEGQPEQWVESYAQIVVTGDIDITGANAQILLDPGVKLRMFVGGDADIAGNGVVNPGSALNYQLYGLDREDGSIGTIKIAGNGGFSGVVYAPNYDIELKGGGNSDNIYGAFTGNTIFMNGVQSVHYDEALAGGAIITGYRIVSWFEDDR